MKNNTRCKSVHGTFSLQDPKFKGMSEKDARTLYVMELMLNNPHLKAQWFSNSQVRYH